ncbi:MAG: hypothetical protein RMZ41_005100 [Nostoc sp. DedVER02]|uniref:hypothetical protein n=1 Tax=unclassified Nostoc TaxID=2593658 RepID=UPI002AD34232|nr:MULTISPECIES: hypothetical protein [unclassified Nostoc]MDZ7990041.1 hypothetical protein [Nostoc sp. DedVER02]MDZ8111781.1 hypothetical protein [Nostoc sp. DedVER01b]
MDILNHIVPRCFYETNKLQLIPWLVEHYRSMDLVKAVRQRHQRTAARSLDIWADVLT